MSNSALCSPFVKTFEEACVIRESKRDKRIVLTNGCFDLLHAGHVYSLEKASLHGDELWVALNSDDSIRNLKGLNRPVYSQEHRAYLLSALSFVSLVFIFDHTNLANQIRELKPDCYVKSGDYDIKKLNVRERLALEDVGTRIFFVPFLEGMSTSKTIDSIHALSK